ncbi:MAG: hypothetical protein V1806_14685 [Pseudomonadota bacterium]
MPAKHPRPVRIQGVAATRRQRRGAAPPAPLPPAGGLAERMLALARESGLPLEQDPGLLEEMARLQTSQDIPAELCLLAGQFLAFVHQADLAFGRGGPRDPQAIQAPAGPSSRPAAS